MGTKMLTLLESYLKKEIPTLLKNPGVWDSLIVNRRKPETYRVFTRWGNLRICLHKFNPCDTHESFIHPHPWPAAFKILRGSYRMRLMRSVDRNIEPTEHISELVMSAGSCYEIVSPLLWHAISPCEETYTVMINGEEWPTDVAHASVRRTKGKDLDKMPEADLLQHLQLFSDMIASK